MSGSPDAAGEQVTCPTCDKAIEPEWVERHFAGLDETRLECGRQDIGAIKRQRERVAQVESVPAWAREW